MEDRFSRQSFLGNKSQEIIQSTVIGVIGLGGGGSHIIQQLAHLGFVNFIIYDSQQIDNSNLNRLVGATEKDVKNKELKINIAKRMIKAIRSKASVTAFAQKWQENPEPLKKADIIFGCIDSFAQRRDLEALTRRYLIPLIDIGMDVHSIPHESPRMAGQVILSMPGYPCLICMNVLNEKSLAQEAGKYGDAGVNPQVIWANGVLASTAVGIAIDILTNWSKNIRNAVYLSYDGNANSMKIDPTFPFIQKDCNHYRLDQIGDPVFKKL